MALEPSCLVAHPGIAGGVALVEGILGEFFPVLPNLVQLFLGMAVGLTTFHKLVFQGVKSVYLLLAHCLAQLVGLSFREVGQLAAEQHHLLLIYRHSVCFLEIFLHFGEVV